MPIEWRKAAPNIARRVYFRARNSFRVRKLYDAPGLRIDAAAGREANALIGFNSRRERAFGSTPYEFVGSASDGGRRHVIFVTDPERRWFQGEGVAARIIDIVGSHLARVGARPRLCLGDSMGGYGSVVFASALGADAWRAPTNEHNVSLHLKTAGLLGNLVEAVAQNDPSRINGTLAQFGAWRLNAAPATPASPAKGTKKLHRLDDVRSET